ncbi:hypothetical protein TorRG33x02_306140 [Trema orientale]|uniref:KIB1-4 beta-propeller domain-containing protein n=1 Tax=Trema orientale TaxID=63057 RepID=A0A2P5BWG0_TREOI|nr:hypothetical protein TorRG33x02_306140 [Trema orientale]
MENKFLELELLVPYGKRFSGSSNGWLVAVNKDWTVTLYKPYSMVKEGNNLDTCIRLPCIFPIELEYDLDDPQAVFYKSMGIDIENLYDYHVYKALITTDPLANPSECTVVVIFGPCNELAFLRLAQDTTWTKIEPTISFLSDDIMHFNGLFYAVNQTNGELISFDVTDLCDSTIKYVAPEVPNFAPQRTHIKRYLVESCGGEILQVERYIKWNKVDNARMTLLFRILRFDFDEKNWIEIENLGDMALFLGDNSSVSISTSDFVGLQPNHIYFTHDIDLITSASNPTICDLGMYDIERKNYKLHFAIDSTTLRKMKSQPPIWVVPTFNEY